MQQARVRDSRAIQIESAPLLVLLDEAHTRVRRSHVAEWEARQVFVAGKDGQPSGCHRHGLQIDERQALAVLEVRQPRVRNLPAAMQAEERQVLAVLEGG